MKRSTKKLVIAVVIILIFGLSSIAFIASSVFYGAAPQTQSSVQPLASQVIDGEISPETEAAYVQGGYTFLKLYTDDQRLRSYAASLPETMTTPTGEVQLFVQRTSSMTTTALIVNAQGSSDVPDVSEAALFAALCDRLMFTPTDCLLRNVTG